MQSLLSSCGRRTFFAPQKASVQRRWLNIHEHQTQYIMKTRGIPVPAGSVAHTPGEVERMAELLGGAVVLKAQVLAGGRGLGKFSSGLNKGVHLCKTATEAKTISEKMFGYNLITKQTTAEGIPVKKLSVSQIVPIALERYFAIALDRSSGGPVIIASPHGGSNIEEHADSLIKVPIDIMNGPTEQQMRDLANKLGFGGDAEKNAIEVFTNLYKMFAELDGTLLEINPLCLLKDGRVMCVDAKLKIDDNAEFRQKALFALRDTSQEDPREVEAHKHDLNYIGLDGSIGCLVNGAGLAMATMDIIQLSGGRPANFLDVGGGATAKQVYEACKIITEDPRVRAVLVNIFGGIMKCDVIALGIVSAATQLSLKVPMVVRLQGTNVQKAKDIIEASGLPLLSADDLQDAAEKTVRVAEIVKLAKDAKLDVTFEIPLI